MSNKMVFDENFPVRHENHVLETISEKIFNNSMPNIWIVRDLTERDYGFDAMLELASSHSEAIGKVAAIQLKAAKKLRFNNAGIYTHYGIDKRTTNYWLNSNLPTFLFFTDELTQKLYYLPVQSYVRENFSAYSSGDKFPYRVSAASVFTPEIFQRDFNECERLIELETHISGLQVLYNNFSTYFDGNHGRDGHMTIDDQQKEGMLNNLYNQVEALCRLTNVHWGLLSVDEFISQNPYGPDLEMYEYHMTEVLKQLDLKLTQCLNTIKQVVLIKQSAYWLAKDAYTVKFLEEFDGITQYQKYRNWVERRRSTV